MKAEGMRRAILAVLAVLAIAGTAGADLLAYYDFTDAGGLPTTENEGTAGTAADGVLMNGATIVDIDPDARGVEHVLKLDYGDGTVNQYMDIGKDWANWDATGLEPFSIAAWIYVTCGTEGGWRTLMSKGWGASWDISMGTPYGAGDGDIAFSAAPAVGGTSPITSSVLSVLCEGYWHHVAGVVEGYGPTAAKLYIDGELQGTAPVWEGVDANDANVLIGADPIKLAEGYDYSWNGMLDNVAIYNSALSAQDVQNIFLGPFALALPPQLEITGPAETAESSQAQYTATLILCVGLHCVYVDVTEDAIWWVEPETFASIDANGLLTVENIDTSENITVHAQYDYYYSGSCECTLEAEMDVLCIAVEYHVDGATGDNGNDGLSRETAFATIQKGIDTAQDGYVVLVWPGTYTEPVDFLGKAITVKSAEEPAVLEAPMDYAVSFYTGEEADSMLKNFIITNSYLGIFIAGSSPTISNITVVGNNSGVEAYVGAEPDIHSCIFWDNADDDLFGCEARYSFVEEELLEDGLVSYWKLDGDAIDSAGSNDGTIYGAVPTTGLVNGALSFDGNNDYVDVGTFAFGASESLTIHALFNSSSGTGGDAILGYSIGPSGTGTGVFVISIGTDGRLYSELMDNNRNNSGPVFSPDGKNYNDGQWHAVAFTRDTAADTINLYIDGGLVDSTTDVTQTGITLDPLAIGCMYDENMGGYWDGYEGTIDDVRIYDRALSAGEVEQLHRSGLEGCELGPLFADPCNGDYHLLSERGRYWPAYNVWVLVDDVTSPCVDGGDPNVEPSAERSPNGGRVNMGAYGNTGYASMSEWVLEADFDRDGIVDIYDLGSLVDDWLLEQP